VKVFLFLFIFSGLVLISSLYLLKEEGDLKPELKEMKHRDKKTIELDKIYNEFSNLNLKSKSINIDKMIIKVKKARTLYPLDDKLKMIEIELDNKKADQTL